MPGISPPQPPPHLREASQLFQDCHQRLCSSLKLNFHVCLTLKLSSRRNTILKPTSLKCCLCFTSESCGEKMLNGKRLVTIYFTETFQLEPDSYLFRKDVFRRSQIQQLNATKSSKMWKPQQFYHIYCLSILLFLFGEKFLSFHK